MNDRAVWAVWYDVAEGDRPAFFHWLHGACLPALAARPELSWVAHYARHHGPLAQSWRLPGEPHERHGKADITCGSEFVLLAGGPSPHAFLDLIRDQDNGIGPGDAATMLARRAGVRHEIFVEEERSFGPAGPDAAGGPPAPCIQFGSFRMASVDRDLLGARWYKEVCFPAMAAAEGSLRTRKWASVAGWSKHGVLYEFSSFEARNRAFTAVQAMRAADPAKVWPIGPHTVHAPGSALVGTRTWPV